MGKGDPPKSRMSQLSTLLVMVTGGYRGISFGPIVHYPESLPTEMPHCSVGPSVKRVIQGLISALT